MRRGGGTRGGIRRLGVGVHDAEHGEKGARAVKARGRVVSVPCRGAEAVAREQVERAGRAAASAKSREASGGRRKRYRGRTDVWARGVSDTRRRQGGVRRVLREAGSDRAGGGVLSGPACWAVRVEQAGW